MDFLPLTNGHGQPNGVNGGSPDMWLVQKFGGTSVGKFPPMIVDNIIG